MRVIKKTIKQIMTTGLTENCNSDNYCFVIIPDENVIYNTKILLLSNNKDFGFFNAMGNDENINLSESQTISGNSKSRLYELKKYKNTNTNFFDNYKLSESSKSDGVSQNKSNLDTNPKLIVYYLDNIEYHDIISNNNTLTQFYFINNGLNSDNYYNKKIYKNPDLLNIINQPKISNDVFIIRQEMPIFQNNFILKDIKNLYELETFIGGNYFNIKQ